MNQWNNQFSRTVWGERIREDRKEGLGGQGPCQARLGGALQETAPPPRSPSQALSAQRAWKSPLAEGSRWGAPQRSTAAEGCPAEWTAGWAAEVAWGWKITDESWGTEKQHKAINNRSKFRSVRILGDPTSPGAGAPPASHSSGQTLLQGTACHTRRAEPFIFHCPHGRCGTPQHRLTARTAEPPVTPEGMVRGCPGPERPVVDSEHLEHCPRGPGPVISWPLGRLTKARRYILPVRFPWSPWAPPPLSPPPALLAPLPPPPPPPGLSPCGR